MESNPRKEGSKDMKESERQFEEKKRGLDLCVLVELKNYWFGVAKR